MSFKSIPSLGSIKSLKDVLRVLEAMKYNMELALGLRGESLDTVITNRSAISSGVAAKNATGTGISPLKAGWSYTATPDAVTGLSAAGALSLIHLTWTAVKFPYVAYYEVWRSATNDIGTATRIGTTQSTVYGDDVAKHADETGKGQTYYYWVRAVSEANKEGPFNAVAGVPGMVGYSYEYALSLLTVKWGASTPAEVATATQPATYIIPTPGNETGVWYKCTTAGTTGATEPTWPTVVGQTVSDGTAVWTAVAAGIEAPPMMIGEVNGVPTVVISKVNIGDATIESAMIHELAADKIITGALAATISITGGLIRTAESGYRVEIDNTFPFWYGTGTKNTTNGRVYIDAAGNLVIKDSSGNIMLSVTGGLFYADGTSIDVLQPSEAGADVTGNNTANNTSNVGSQSATNVQNSTINFNNRNDRKTTTPANPTVATDGTAVDHTISTDGSANISFEWTFSGSGDAYDIDGFLVYVRQSTSSSSYTFGTTPAEEQIFVVEASKRAVFAYGVPANQYYTFGVQAYRNVDNDINASGVLKSAIVKATGTGENPYRPSSSVAFAGDVTGTVDGETAADIADGALRALAIIDGDLNVSGHIKSSTLQSTSLYTSGTHLTAACSSGATTLNVKDTTDFPTSGSGFIFDSSNNKDAFSWTGKTATTLTGCSGVLAHNAGAVVAFSGGASILVNNLLNELQIYGSNGYGQYFPLISIGPGTDNILGDFGDFTNNRTAIRARSYSGIAIYAENYTSNFAIVAYNNATEATIRASNASESSLAKGLSVTCAAGTGVYINANIGISASCGTYGAQLIGLVSPLRLYPDVSAAAPSHSADVGSLWVTSAGVLYINTSGSTTWQKVGAQ